LIAKVACRAEFEAAREAWGRAIDAGRFDEALAGLDAGYAWAAENGESDLRDRAFVVRAAILLETGAGVDLAAELRELLMRSRDAENGFLAAYSLARACELRKETKKALFYAQLGRDRSESLDRGRRAASQNQLANLLVAESRFEEAVGVYRSALGLIGPAEALRRAVILDNLGYCEALLGRRPEGLALLRDSLRDLRRLGAERHEMLARLDYCFVLLEVGKPAAARRHGRRALALATALAVAEAEKNALYLLGSAAAALGDRFGARRWYQQLQSGFYPDADYLPDVLLQVDVLGLVNLKA
jgi:tetratricopeptide (TPR) repeat protein